MIITKPDYYDRFRCAGGSCPDSCCQSWEVDVDEASAARYRSLPGPLGDRLRNALEEGEDGTFIAMKNGRCPLWEDDGLCGLQKALGEAELCQVCRTFPRLQHDYGDFMELGLELSCPEAARYILSSSQPAMITGEVPGGDPPDYDREDMALLLSSRETMRALLADSRRPFGQCLCLGLLYGCQVQSALDGGTLEDLDEAQALSQAAAWAKPGSMGEILALFSGLEILTPQWRELLSHPEPAQWEPGHRALARYLVDRYWLQAVSDLDIYGRVKFLVTACLTVRHLGGNLLRTAQLFSKEIENDWDNLEALLTAAYESPALRDDRLFGLLLL